MMAQCGCVAYVVSGLGFLGAGVIMRGEGSVRGLNTAATLWCSAGIGACAGADLILEAASGTLFVLAANTLLRSMVNYINHQPIDTPAVEETNTIYVIASRTRQKEALELVQQFLEQIDHPVSDLAIHAFGAEDVEIEAALAAASMDGDQLDKLVRRLAEHPFIQQAFWSPSTTE